MGGRILYLVGGAPRVGKSVLAQRLLETEGIPWLPTDAVRTVLRRVLPELDAADQDPVDAAQLAKYMYPHIEQVAGVCAEEAERFLIEGFELSPWYRGRLEAALDGTRVRACFLGHSTFSADDLAAYRGPKPQHEGEASRAELTEAAAPSWAGCGCATWTRGQSRAERSRPVERVRRSFRVPGSSPARQRLAPSASCPSGETAQTNSPRFLLR